MAFNNPLAGENLVKNATTSVFTIKGASPVSGNAQAHTMPINISVPFLPGTVLKDGANGKTFNALRARLQLLYEKRFINVSPYANIDTYQRRTADIKAHADNKATWEAVKAYINQGVSYKTNNFLDKLQNKARCSNYDVDRDVWESLNLPIASTWEEMFGSINVMGPTIGLKLKGNTATITWKPRIQIVSDLPIPDELYNKLLQECLDGVLRWNSADAKNRVGGKGKKGSLNVQGVVGNVQIIIKDVKDNQYTMGKPIKDFCFTKSFFPKSPNLVIKLNKGGNIWVPSVLFPGWNYNNNLKITINYPYSNVIINQEMKLDAEKKLELYSREIVEKESQEKIDDRTANLLRRLKNKKAKLENKLRNEINGVEKQIKLIGRIVEHEFGHVAGLFDAYDYGKEPVNREPDDTRFYGKHNWAAGQLYPGAQKSDYICEDSVMICNWKETEFTRTALDYEMLLFAYRDNKMQSYVDNIYGLRSQAFFHSGRYV